MEAEIRDIWQRDIDLLAVYKDLGRLAKRVEIINTITISKSKVKKTITLLDPSKTSTLPAHEIINQMVLIVAPKLETKKYQNDIKPHLNKFLEAG
jgi:hypothetical protein